MAINYEFERAIGEAVKLKDHRAVKFLRAQDVIFRAGVSAGIIKDLPREHIEMTEDTEVVPLPVAIPKAGENSSLRESIIEEVLNQYEAIEVNGKLIRVARRQQKVTQEELADKTSSFTRQGILRLENHYSSRFTSTARAMEIANALGIPILELVLIPQSELIKAWRRAKGLRQIDIVRNSEGKISKGLISSIEKGRIKSVSNENLELIALSLGISLDTLRARILPDEIN